MSKKVKLLLVSLVIVMIGIGIAAVPFQENIMAADSLDIEVPPMYRHSEDGEMGGYHGIGHVVHESIDAVSELLGLSPEEIREERESGKSLVEIAEEQGVSEDALIEAIMAAPKEAIEQKVEDGILTEEQADHLIERLEQRVIWRINRTDVEAAGYSGCNGGERHAKDTDFGMAGQRAMTHDCDGTEGQCFGKGNSISRPNAGNQYAMQWA